MKLAQFSRSPVNELLLVVVRNYLAETVRDESKVFLEFRWTFVNDTSPFRLVAGFTRRIG